MEEGVIWNFTKFELDGWMRVLCFILCVELSCIPIYQEVRKIAVDKGVIRMWFVCFFFHRWLLVLCLVNTFILQYSYNDVVIQLLYSVNSHALSVYMRWWRFFTVSEKLKFIIHKLLSLNERVSFRDGIKWIWIYECGSYLYKESYDEYAPSKKLKYLVKMLK